MQSQYFHSAYLHNIINLTKYPYGPKTLDFGNTVGNSVTCLLVNKTFIVNVSVISNCGLLQSDVISIKYDNV